MKSLEEIKSMLFAILAELQDGRTTENNPDLKEYLKIRLELLVDILGDDLPGEYYQQINDLLMED